MAKKTEQVAQSGHHKLIGIVGGILSTMNVLEIVCTLWRQLCYFFPSDLHIKKKQKKQVED